MFVVECDTLINTDLIKCVRKINEKEDYFLEYVFVDNYILRTHFQDGVERDLQFDCLEYKITEFEKGRMHTMTR